MAATDDLLNSLQGFEADVSLNGIEADAVPRAQGPTVYISYTTGKIFTNKARFALSSKLAKRKAKQQKKANIKYNQSNPSDEILKPEEFKMCEQTARIFWLPTDEDDYSNWTNDGKEKFINELLGN